MTSQLGKTFCTLSKYAIEHSEETAELEKFIRVMFPQEWREYLIEQLERGNHRAIINIAEELCGAGEEQIESHLNDRLVKSVSSNEHRPQRGARLKMQFCQLASYMNNEDIEDEDVKSFISSRFPMKLKKFLINKFNSQGFQALLKDAQDRCDSNELEMNMPHSTMTPRRRLRTRDQKSFREGPDSENRLDGGKNAEKSNQRAVAREKFCHLLTLIGQYEGKPAKIQEFIHHSLSDKLQPVLLSKLINHGMKGIAELAKQLCSGDSKILKSLHQPVDINFLYKQIL